MVTNGGTKSVRIIAFDLDFSLRGSGLKREFFASADIDYDHFNERFQRWTIEAHPELSEETQRQMQPQFLLEEMKNGKLRSISTGRLGQTLEVHQFFEFGETLHYYEGVVETLVAVRKAVADQGHSPVVAILTNAYAPLVRLSQLFRDGLVDVVHGPEFTSRLLGGKAIAMPLPFLDNGHPKVKALNSLMSKFRVGGASVLFASDPFGAGPVMSHLHAHGGRNVGFFNPREPRSKAGDQKRLDELEAKGLLDARVDNDFTEEGEAREVLVAQARLLTDARFRMVDHAPDRGLERDSLTADLTA